MKGLPVSLCIVVALSGANPASAVDLPADEAARVHRDADSPMRWILMTADRPHSQASGASAASPQKHNRALQRGHPKTSNGGGTASPRSPAEAPPDLVSIDEVQAVWDAALVQKLRRGDVRISILVDPDGEIAKADAVSSSDARLIPAALAAARQWHFAALPKARRATIDFGFDLDR